MNVQRELRFETVTKDMVNEVVALINRVTCKLLAKNINQWKYPCDDKAINDDIVKERIVAIKNEEKIIGVFSIKEIENFFDIALGDKMIFYVYRIAVDTDFQGKGIGALIIDYCKKYGKDKGKEMYLDCWEGNDKLRDFYDSHGLTYINDYKEEDFFVSVYML